MIKYALLMLAATVLFATNCKKDKSMKDDELSIPRTPFNGNQLKLNGYYYYTYTTSSSITYYQIYHLYSNGIILGGDVTEEGQLSQGEQKMQNGIWYSDRKNNKSSWGVFIIEGNNIKFERWYCAEGFCKAYVRAGTIVNDTTFLITESYRMKDGQKTEANSKNETYYFKQFSPKPDSTNTFIE